MKTLILVRHAQAVDIWSKIHGQKDHDRPLTTKWVKQAKKLPKLLKKLDLKPDRVISSTANRCHDTAKQICKRFDIELHTEENLYFKGIDPYLADIAVTTDNIQSLVIVWHNDDLTDLVSILLCCNFPPVVKWSATVIEFTVDSWEDVKKGKLKCYLTV